MSPEQATGDDRIGPSTDIWATGCVLYEMLVGEPPYTGSTPQAVLGRVITAEAPSASDVRKSVSSNVDATIRKCLEKVPADRFKSAGEVARALSHSEFRTDSTAASRGAARSAPIWNLPTALSAFVALLALFFAAWAYDRPTTGASAVSVRHLSVVLPDSLRVMFVGEHWTGNGQTAFTLSPDGERLVYVGRAGATTRLYVRSINEREPRPLEGTEGASSPAFSPDGTTVAYLSAGRVMRISADGGAAQIITEANLATSPPTWAQDGRVAVVHGDGVVLRIASASGETATVLRPGGNIAHPNWIPGTEWILLTCFEPKHICASSSTGELIPLASSGRPAPETPMEERLMGSDARFVEPGFLVYSAPSRNALVGVSIDRETLEISGAPEVLLEAVRRERDGSLQVAVSSTGDLWVARGSNAEVSRLVWARAGGAIDTLPFPTQTYGTFALSPNDRRVAIDVIPDVGSTELWFFDLERGPPGIQLGGVDSVISRSRGWSPGSDRLLARLRDSVVEIDGAAPRGARRIGTSAGLGWPADVGSDGRILFIRAPGQDTATATLVHPDELSSLRGPSDERVTTLPIRGTIGLLNDLSPNMHWLAYTATSSGAVSDGQYEVYALRLADGRSYRISAGPGETPRWSPRGDGIYYRDGPRFYWVPVTESAEEPFGTPQLFASGGFINVAGPEIEVSADGRALLLLQSEGSAETTTLDLIENFRNVLIERLGRSSRPP
jgi:serine/threonine-protein kinase